jgi:hypothetical protein
LIDGKSREKWKTLKSPQTTELKMMQLSLFLDGTGNIEKCKLQITSLSTGLKRVHYLNIENGIFCIKNHLPMCSYGGYHGTFDVTRLCPSMKSGVWSPDKNTSENVQPMPLTNSLVFL